MGNAMARKLNIIGGILLVLFISSIIAPSFVNAQSRQTNLNNFINRNFDSLSGGFYDYKNDAGTSVVSPIATSAALEILNNSGQLSSYSDQLVRIESWLGDQILTCINQNDTSDLAYILNGLKLVNDIGSISSDTHDSIINYLVSLKQNYGNAVGYGLTATQNASVAGTYFALECYNSLGLSNLVPTDNVSQFILDCFDQSGGFTSNVDSSDVSLINTYYALESLNMTNLSDSITNKTQIASYINSFYVNNPELPNDNGGYTFVPSEYPPYTSFVPTFMSVMSLRVLYSDYTMNQTTVDWILNHQNPNDGGFRENANGNQQIQSSVVVSFYAYQMLSLNYPTLSILNQEAWGSTVNWWLVVGIILVIIAVIVAVIVIIRRRNAL